MEARNRLNAVLYALYLVNSVYVAKAVLQSPYTATVIGLSLGIIFLKAARRWT